LAARGAIAATGAAIIDAVGDALLPDSLGRDFFFMHSFG
jgi:hypothetical protein